MSPISDKRPRLLLVEDDPLISLSEKKSLESYGYDVSLAPNVRSAMSAVASGDFDMILMDIDLGDPDFDGTDLARQILQLHDLPVIFLSNHTERELVEKTEEIGSYGYVTKSSGMTVLHASIRMAFKHYDAKLRFLQHDSALSAAEKRYRTILENHTDGYLRVDDTGIILETNPAYEEISGYRDEELIGIRLEELEAMESPDQIRRRMNTLNAGRGPRFLTIHRRKNGKLISGELTTMLLEHGGVREYAAFFRPMDSMGTGDRLMREMLLQVPGSVYQFRLDPSGTFSLPFATDNFWNLFELHPADLRTDASALFGRMHPDDVEDVRSNILASAEELHTWEGRFRVLLPSAGERWLAGVSKPSAGVAGEIIWNGYVWDDTDNAWMHDQLDDYRQRLQFAVDGSRVGLWDFHVPSGEVYFSPIWKEMLGYADEEIQADVSEWSKRIHPDDYHRTMEDLNRVLVGGEDYYESEHRLLHKSGRYVWILDRGMVVERDGGGGVVRMIGNPQRYLPDQGPGTEDQDAS
jgi:PAS domain S-box-containing protein